MIGKNSKRKLVKKDECKKNSPNEEGLKLWKLWGWVLSLYLYLLWLLV